MQSTSPIQSLEGGALPHVALMKGTAFRRQEWVLVLSLLQVLVLAVGTDECVKNGENVASIFDHAGKNVAQMRLAFRVPMPFRQNCRRNLNIPAQLIRRMSTKEQAVEKGRFTLRKLEVRENFNRKQWSDCSHIAKTQFTQNFVGVK